MSSEEIPVCKHKILLAKTVASISMTIENKKVKQIFDVFYINLHFQCDRTILVLRDVPLHIFKLFSIYTTAYLSVLLNAGTSVPFESAVMTRLCASFTMEMNLNRIERAFVF